MLLLPLAGLPGPGAVNRDRSLVYRTEPAEIVRAAAAAALARPDFAAVYEQAARDLEEALPSGRYCATSASVSGSIPARPAVSSALRP